MRKTVKIDKRNKECTENRKKVAGKSRSDLLPAKFFSSKIRSSPNPLFSLNICPVMFKGQNLLGHFNLNLCFSVFLLVIYHPNNLFHGEAM